MLIWLVPLTLLIVLEAFADVLAKQWSIAKTPLWFAAAIGGYIAANIFWLFALKNGSGLARGGIIFSVLSAILAVAIGLLMYHETLSKLQLAGVVVGIVAVALIFWE